METNMQAKENWFVGATWGKNNDQTPRFLQKRIWENGHDDKYQEFVRSMRPGDRIAIKFAPPKHVYDNLPFDNHGKGVRVMYIKAIGTITENLNDGTCVRVNWKEQYTPRKWYFYSKSNTVWRVKPGEWRADALLAFTFNGECQNIDRFIDRYLATDEDVDEATAGDEGRGEDSQDHRPTDQHITIRIPELHEIKEHLEKTGHFPASLCEQIHLGLWANERRHFAILTGISGSGKTLLACKYGEALTGGKAPYVCVIPVQPGWTDPSFLVGYPNPIRGDSYERTRFLKLLLNAKENPAIPHVAILDEMNLSHPEQYLAPVLSAMETGNELDLHGREDNFDGVPRSIPYPKNLVLIGTVNMDETTMGLSDKVLDRAFTIEFWDIDVGAWPGWVSHQLQENQADKVKGVLRELMDALKPARLHFGYRVIDEVVAFLTHREAQAPEWDFTEAFDNVIYAKVLPKLRGDDSTRVRTAFDKCKEVLQRHDLTSCVAKVEDLKKDLESTGSARFWR